MQPRTAAEAAQVRLQTAGGLGDGAARDIGRQYLRRQHGGMSEEEVDEVLSAWLKEDAGVNFAANLSEHFQASLALFIQKVERGNEYASRELSPTRQIPQPEQPSVPTFVVSSEEEEETTFSQGLEQLMERDENVALGQTKKERRKAARERKRG